MQRQFRGCSQACTSTRTQSLVVLFIALPVTFLCCREGCNPLTVPKLGSLPAFVPHLGPHNESFLTPRTSTNNHATVTYMLSTIMPIWHTCNIRPSHLYMPPVHSTCACHNATCMQPYDRHGNHTPPDQTAAQDDTSSVLIRLLLRTLLHYCCYEFIPYQVPFATGNMC